jgi:pyrimidine deaminase RibD-like protein
MLKAIAQGKKSEQIQSAYCVGCIITNSNSSEIYAEGYSRELEGNTHAEECALIKLSQIDAISGDLVVYTTMEPCSTRLSGKKSCTERIIEYNSANSGIRRIVRVVIGMKEPDHFVQCQGTRILEQNGIEIEYEHDSDIVQMCAQLNSHIQ